MTAPLSSVRRTPSAARLGSVKYFGKGVPISSCAGVARHAAHGLVHIGDVQHRIDGDQAVERGFDQAAVVGALFRQLGLQPGLIGDVAGAGENAAHVAGRVPENRGIERHLQLPPVARGQRQNVVGDDALLEGLVHAGSGAVGIDEVVGERRADQLLARDSRTCGTFARSRPRSCPPDRP